MVIFSREVGCGLSGKEPGETSWGHSNVLYFHRCLGYTGIRICQNSADKDMDYYTVSKF